MKKDDLALFCQADQMTVTCRIQLCWRLMDLEDRPGMEFIPGDIVEFGCYQGHTAALMSALSNRRLWVYDSFQGLPEKTDHDVTRADFIPGALSAKALDVFNYFRLYDLKQPIIVGKWFKDLRPDELPGQIAFAHLDCDFYQSILESLTIVYPRLATGGVCLIHDYDNPDLPGVQMAVKHFLNTLAIPPAKQFVSAPLQLCIVK